jgi:hypothetical protein
VGHGSARGPCVSDDSFAKYVARKHIAVVERRRAAVGGLMWSLPCLAWVQPRVFTGLSVGCV